jgi:hypothetical protein
MLSRGALFALLFSALAARAKQDVAGQERPPNPSETPRRTVTGTVADGISGEPIRHALVQAWGGALSASALTGPDGRFTIEELPGGAVNYVVTKPGYFDPGFIRARPPDGTNTVGSNKNDVRLVLLPNARIVGRLTEQDGEPIEGTQVQLLFEQIFNGHKQVVTRNSAFTDDDGVYRLDDLVPGRYIVFAAGQSLPAATWDGPREVSAPAYYPGVPELASARIVELQPGQEFRADLHLPVQPGFRVSGTFAGHPTGSGLSVALENSAGQSVLTQAVTADPEHGRFVVDAVPSGTWTLTVWTTDLQGHSYAAREQIAVNGADIPNLQVLLHPVASIPVVQNHPESRDEGVSVSSSGGVDVYAPGGQHVLIGSVNGTPGLDATLLGVDGWRVYGATAHADPPGISFENVAPGKYKLDIQSFGGECVESVWYGNVDLLHDYLVIGSDSGTQPITVNLSNHCATLSAKAASGERQNSGSLVVVASSSLNGPVVLPLGPSGGSYTLSPGSYQVYAFDNVDGLEYANPEVLRDYPSQSIDLAAGQKTELTVKLIQRKGN